MKSSKETYRNRECYLFAGGLVCIFTGMLWFTPRTNFLSPTLDILSAAFLYLVWRQRNSWQRLTGLLEESEQRFRSFMDHSPALKIIADSEGRLLYFNETFVKALRFRPEELAGKSLHDVFPAEHADKYMKMVQAVIRTGESIDSVEPGRRNDGSVAHFLICMFPLNDKSGERLVGAAAIDVTAHKQAEQALRVNEKRYRSLVAATTQVCWTTDARGLVREPQPAWQEYTGQSAAEAMGDGWAAALHQDDVGRVREAWKRAIAEKAVYKAECRVRRVDGEYRDHVVRGVPVIGDDGRVEEWIGTCTDITVSKQAEERLIYLAHYDSLTNLPNRVMFGDRLKQALAQAQRNRKVVGVLFLDLDRFKLVNDTLGHGSGDRLLRLVSQRLTGCLRNGDAVCRLGGDEFAVILPGLDSMDDAGPIAQKISEALVAPFALDGHEIFATASVGIAAYPGDGLDGDMLVKKADMALYSAKALGGNNYQFYAAGMNERVLEKVRMETLLRRALERREFVLHYQPKMDVASGEIAGFEALLRWQSPDAGLVSPAQFIPLLEETGLIVQVGEWVVDAACAQIKSWQLAGVKPLPVAVNLSARQFQQPGLESFIRETLAKHETDPRLLEVEITESSLMQKPEDAVAVLKNLKALGIRISVDDFGTGYSSLSYLKRFPLDALKIDRSFVRDLTTNPDDEAITRAIVTMAHSLDLKVIAEGVETEEQLTFLTTHSCDEVQGYLLAKPLPAVDCTTLLTMRRRLLEPSLIAGAQVTTRASRSLTVLLVDGDADNLQWMKRSLERDGYLVVTATDPREAFKLLAALTVHAIVAGRHLPDIPVVEFFKRVQAAYPAVMRIAAGENTGCRTTTAANDEDGRAHFANERDDELFRRNIRKAIRVARQRCSALAMKD